jgi:hypothetical protein
LRDAERPWALGVEVLRAAAAERAFAFGPATVLAAREAFAFFAAAFFAPAVFFGDFLAVV